MTDDSAVVGDRYVIGALLGRGGMAEVHRAVDQRLGRPVAVKRLSTALAADPTAQTRFQREAHAAASLNHPAVASVFDTGSDVDPSTGVDVPYLVMELVEGRTLRAVLRDGPRLSAERSLEVVSQVLAALAHSHAAGIVHRDIKPANVMLTPAGAVKVMDFGIARAADDSTTSLTQGAGVIGTAQYFSPEQARGEQVDRRSDLYSTGCLLYELLLGRPTFVGDSSVSLAYQHVNEDPVPPRDVDPSLSPEVDAVVLRALAKDPAQRYQSADEMRTAIDRILSTGRVRGGAATPLAATTTVRAAPVPAVTSSDDRPTAVVARTAAAAPVVLPVAAAPVAPPPPVDQEPPVRGRGGRVLLVVLALLVVAALAVFALPQLLGSGTPAATRVTVPDVTGRSRAEADTALRNADLVPRFTNVKGKDDDTLDKVTGQTPKGGTEADTGSDVTVEVNVGPDSAKIPKGLVGEDVSDAKKTLAEAGFDDVSTRRATTQPADAEKDEVLSVEPGEGSLLPLDDRVVLVLARAPQQATTQPPTEAPTTTEPTRSTEPTDPPESTRAPTKKPTTEPTSDPTSSSSPTGASDPTSSGSPSAKKTKAAKKVEDAKAKKGSEPPGSGSVQSDLQ